MRVHLISDLHQEAAKYYVNEDGHQKARAWGEYDPMPGYKPPECDVVVLAGDINEGVEGVLWARHMFPHVPVLYVPGNHEYYGYRANELRKVLIDTCEGTNVHLLDNRDIVIGDVHFIGATLWTDFELFGTGFISALHCESNINDFDFIAGPDGRLITRIDVMEWHKRDRYFLSEAMRERKAAKQVVVTHFAPTERSGHHSWMGSRTGPYFASRLENLICDRGPDYWFHGHMHSSADHMISETRIINNPRGNIAHHANKNFNPELVIEI